MVGQAARPKRTVYVDLSLTPSNVKVKVTGLLNFWQLAKPCMLAAMTAAPLRAFWFVDLCFAWTVLTSLCLCSVDISCMQCWFTRAKLRQAITGHTSTAHCLMSGWNSTTLLLTRHHGKMFRRTVLAATTTLVPTALCTSTLTIQTFIRLPASVVSKTAKPLLFFNDHFPGDVRSTGFLLVFFICLFWKRIFEDKWQRLLYTSYACHPTSSFKVLKEAQSTDPRVHGQLTKMPTCQQQKSAGWHVISTQSQLLIVKSMRRLINLLTTK